MVVVSPVEVRPLVLTGSALLISGQGWVQPLRYDDRKGDTFGAFDVSTRLGYVEVESPVKSILTLIRIYDRELAKRGLKKPKAKSFVSRPCIKG